MNWKIKVNWCWVCLFACLLSLRSSGGWLPPLTPQRKRKANSTNSLRVGNTQSNQLLAFHAQPQLMDELFVAPLAYRGAFGSLGRRFIHSHSFHSFHFHWFHQNKNEIHSSFRSFHSQSLFSASFLCFLGRSSSLWAGCRAAAAALNPPKESSLAKKSNKYRSWGSLAH